MELTFKELKKRDVINIADGRCLGRITDLKLKFPQGVLTGIFVPGKRYRGLFWFLDKNTIFIDESKIVKIGGDVILVNLRRGDISSPPDIPSVPEDRPRPPKPSPPRPPYPPKPCPPPCPPQNCNPCVPPCPPNDCNPCPPKFNPCDCNPCAPPCPPNPCESGINHNDGRGYNDGCNDGCNHSVPPFFSQNGRIDFGDY